MMSPKHAARQRAQRWGHQAEWLAVLWLWATGHRILARRWAHPLGEIDIIARKKSLILFVEVKARATLQQAADALTYRQQQRMHRASLAFLQRAGLQGVSWRYDGILIAPWRLPKYIHDIG